MATFNQKFKNSTDFQNQIIDLNNKINSVAKNLTYFDFYNIVDVVTNKNNFNGQINNLTQNSSLIINCNPFYSNEEYYNTGDIIFKSSVGNIVHIRAQTGGIYYPYKIITEDNGSTYNIQYKYSAIKPTINSTEVNGVLTEDGKKEWKATLAETINFKQLTSEEQGSIYGLWQEFPANGLFEASFKNNIAIQPYIKFYLCDNSGNNMEEISIDYILTLNNTQWKIDFVDNSVNTANLWMKVK